MYQTKKGQSQWAFELEANIGVCADSDRPHRDCGRANIHDLAKSPTSSETMMRWATAPPVTMARKGAPA